MKTSKIIVSVLCSFIISIASFHSLAKDNQCTLNLGFDSWEPYQFMGIGQEVRGLDIDLVEMVAKRMNCKVSYSQAPWIDLLAQIRTGEIDMLLGASKTAKREEFAMFSSPYRTEKFSLFIRKADDDLLKLKSFSEFINKGKKIGVVDDYFYGDELTELRDSSESNQFVSAIMGELNVARLLDENIDAYFEDSIVGASMIRRKGLSTRIVPHGLSIETGDVYVMFSKKSVSEDTVNQFNQELSKVIKSGEYDKLVKMYK